MRRNWKKYFQAWNLRKQGKLYREIGKELNLSVERVRVLNNYFDFTLKNRKSKIPSSILKIIFNKYE